jgi:hypothetical protein
MLLRRFGSNVKQFPTLALVTVLLLVGAIAEITLIVGLLNHSLFHGILAAVGIIVIEAAIAFAVALSILRDSTMSARVQSLADLASHYVSSYESTVDPDEYPLDEDDETVLCPYCGGSLDEEGFCDDCERTDE